LAASGLPACRLELEITESIVMQKTDVTLRALHRLRELGVQISMDDFGTCYSSLSNLWSFPFNKIKIDRSFINDLPNGNDALAIVQAVTSLAHTLSMTTTAEDVETEQQLETLRAVGCGEMQGYLFSQPIRSFELTRLLFAHRDKAAKVA
jgi:EAL domain-containing protein (putative c-di-GMP-specific phosphodiesterase class I)